MAGESSGLQDVVVIDVVAGKQAVDSLLTEQDRDCQQVYWRQRKSE